MHSDRNWPTPAGAFDLAPWHTRGSPSSGLPVSSLCLPACISHSTLSFSAELDSETSAQLCRLHEPMFQCGKISFAIPALDQSHPKHWRTLQG